MRLTKIYTKVGDKGQTMLASGDKVPKDSLRIDCYGTVDELNSFVGLLKDTLHGEVLADLTTILAQLETVQDELFDLGGELATPGHVLNLERQKVVGIDEVKRLENEIDTYNGDIPPLENFVLPGGFRGNSLAHVCRTICRRAERLAVKLQRDDASLRPETIIYLNRLSDWFFVLARTLSHRAKAPEQIWRQKRK